MHPPKTRIDAVRDSLHGHAITDRYRWLEGDNSDPDQMGAATDEVAAWTDAQNAYTRARLDTLPGREAVEQALRPLMEIAAVSAPIVRGDVAFFSRREGKQNQPVFYVRAKDTGEDQVLLDPGTLDPTGSTVIDWIAPSHDGRIVAYGTYRAGDENTSLHVLSLESRKELEPAIPGKAQAPYWLPDGSGFIYQNLRDAKDPYSGQVRFHRLGTDAVVDPVLHRQFTKEENIDLATTWGPTASLSYDGRWLLLGYWTDTQSNDAWLADLDAFRATGRLEKRIVSVGETGHIGGTVIADRLFLHTTKGAPKGRIVVTLVDSPGSENWRDLIVEHKDAVIEAVNFGKGVVAVTYLHNASNYVEVFSLSGDSLGRIAQPGIGAAGMATEDDRTTAYLTFTSFNVPTSIFEVNLLNPAAPPRLWAQPNVPVNPQSVVVKQVWFASKDGTPISMFLVHRVDLTLAGEAPTIVTGYGGFNVSETPMFVATWFQWFDAGGVIAIPNLRGGGEYGDAWHEAGMLERKQNVFDDFQAAITWLTDNNYTNSTKVAISGGSNGGLLIGATITQHPELCRAAIVAVPLLDMLRYQYFLMARYWVPEYGTAEDPSQFLYLHAYSPYHRVVDGTAYPAVLLTAGENDTRVHAMHARKMAAALQTATVSDPDNRPVLLWVDREAGHGQGKPLNLRLRDAVDQRVFLMWQLDMLDGNPAVSLSGEGQ